MSSADGQDENGPDQSDYQGRLHDMEAKLKEVQAKEEELTLKMQQEIRAEMDARLEGLQGTLQSSFTNRMHNMEDRYKEHTSGIVSIKQTEVLRANKVLREVARGLGPDWRYIFKYLMAGFPKEVIDIEMEKLERVRPFMQPYKALLTWKEYKAEEFDIRLLIKALDDNLKNDLAQLAADIMESEGESLLSMNIGRGIVSGAEETYTSSNDDSGAASGVENIDPNDPDITMEQRKKISLKIGDKIVGPLGDTKMLQCARKLGADWLNVANMLDLPEEDINEFKEIEDECQRAFRMMWQWRDFNSDKKEEELVSNLQSTLKRCGRTELADIFNKKDSSSSA